MKDKVIIFIIGLLLGAIISTGTICLYSYSTNSNNNNNNQQMNGGQPPEMPNGTNGGQPPEMSNNNNNNTQNRNQVGSY